MSEHPSSIATMGSGITSTAHFTQTCAVALILGSIGLTWLGGEAGGEHILLWLTMLAGLTVVWLVSLGGKSVTTAWVLGTALADRV